MRIALALALLSMLAAPAFAQDEGFETLFNGKDFAGWKFFLGKGDPDPTKTFSVADGVVVCTGKPAGYMYTEKKYKDYTLRFEYRYKRLESIKEGEDFKWGGNSGYLHWIKDHNVWPRSLETQGMNKEIGKIYWIGAKKEEQGKVDWNQETTRAATKPLGEWNAYEVVAKNEGEVVVSLNGQKVTHVHTHPYKGEGHLGFQSEGAEINWRNIRIKVN